MTLRTEVLVEGAVLGSNGRKKVLHLGLRGRWRERFATLLQRISEPAASTVAQFAADSKDPALRPWKPHSLLSEVFGLNSWLLEVPQNLRAKSSDSVTGRLV
jgi:hypothetical protein